MILPMELAAILRRVEERLQVLGISAREVARRAGKPRVIPNLRRAVKDGTRAGISTGTLSALARALEVRQEWLLTGDGHAPAPPGGAEQGLPAAEAVTLISWVLQVACGLAPDEARIAARAVLRAFRTREDRQGAPLSEDQRFALVESLQFASFAHKSGSQRQILGFLIDAANSRARARGPRGWGRRIPPQAAPMVAEDSRQRRATSSHVFAHASHVLCSTSARKRAMASVTRTWSARSTRISARV